MNEADYWQALEYRVCRELARSEDRSVRFLWCDGFVAEHYVDNDGAPRIVGRAWIYDGQRQDPWQFTLLLGGAAGAREAILWDTLLPSDEAAGWLELDSTAHRLQITPPSR